MKLIDAKIYESFKNYILSLDRGFCVVYKHFSELGVEVFDEELCIVEPMSHFRRAEFVAGRNALRSMFKHFDVAPTSILRGASGAPIMPKSLVGSLSHKNGYILAVLGNMRYLGYVGCDLETNSGKDYLLFSEFFCEEELRFIIKLNINADVLFSAKEAIYKLITALGGGVKAKFLGCEVKGKECKFSYFCNGLKVECKSFFGSSFIFSFAYLVGELQ